MVLGPGAWALIAEPLRRAAMGNAQTFIDLREDPDWASLDVAAVARFDGPVTITRGSVSPDWLRRVTVAAAERLGCEPRVLPGAGRAPHLTRPAELVAIVEERLRPLP